MKKNKIFHFFPSLIWFNFIVFGCLIDLFFSKNINNYNYFITILIIFFSFIISDYTFYKKDKSKIKFNTLTNETFIKFFYFYLLIVFVHINYVIANVYNYDLFNFINFKINNITNPSELQFDKGKFNRFLEMPRIIQYLINLNINIFFPLVLFNLKKIKKIFFFLIQVIYLIIIEYKYGLFISSCYLIISYMLNLNFKKGLIILGNIFLVIIILFHINDLNKNIMLKTPLALDFDKNYKEYVNLNRSLAYDFDQNYENDYSIKTITNDQINKLTYRLILIPQFTASKWYQSKEEIFENKNIFFKYLYKSDANEKLSNQIGVYYFNKARPEKWFKNIHANASFDADAYVRFGYLGILFIIIALNTIRYQVFKIYSSKNNYFYFQIYLLLTLGYFHLISASFQSLLISQGYIIIVLFILKNFYYKFNLVR